MSDKHGAETSTGAGGGDTPPNENRGPAVLIVTIILTVLSTLFVLLRLISRLAIVRRRWSWDDWFILLAWALSFGFSFSICWGVHVGLGLHDVYIPPRDASPLRKSEYAFSVLYNPALMATKTSILLFYLGLAKNRRFVKWGSFTTLLIVNAAGLALTFLNIFQCRPVWAVFVERSPDYAVCTDLVALYLSSAPVNIITDLAILLLPMPMLTAMRIPRKEKIILVVTFGFGIFVAVVDVVRIAYLQQAFQTRLQETTRGDGATLSALGDDDFAWYASLSFMWSAIEVHVGIICASVPSLKPLAAKMVPDMLHDNGDPAELSVFRADKHWSADHLAASPDGPSKEQVPASEPQFITSALDSGDQQEVGHGNAFAGTHRPALPRDLRSRDGVSNADTGSAISTTLVNHSTAAERKANAKVGPGAEMDFLEFLTTPDMQRPIGPTSTAAKLATLAAESQESMTFFDFYNIGNRKPMTELSARESYLPVSLVTILFFLWGFAYGLLDQLNSRFETAVGLSSGQAKTLHVIYFGAYLVGPPTIGQLVLRKHGFKSTFICGLCIYAIGTLVFWPSAVLTSFPAFLVSNFIVGLGVSVIEVAANPFIALCGPQRFAETRLNITQGVQAIGTVLAPLLAEKVLFVYVDSASSLIDVQWTYLAIALFDVALAVVFFYLPIPEASDADYEKIADKRHDINAASIAGFRIVQITLAMGVFAMFCYVGAQESVSVAFMAHITEINASTSSLSPFDWQTVGHVTFAAGRFFCAGATLVIKPRWMLLALFVGMIVTSSLAMHLSNQAGGAMLVMYEFFQGGIFPLIFAITLRGLGRQTKMGAILLNTATSGGAIFPIIRSAADHRHGYQYGICVAIAATAFGTLYPLYLVSVPAAQKQVDPVHVHRSPILPAEDPATSSYGWVNAVWEKMKRRRSTSDVTNDSRLVGHAEQEKGSESSEGG